MPGAQWLTTLTNMFQSMSQSRVGRGVPGDLANTLVGPSNVSNSPRAYLPGNVLCQSANMLHYRDPWGLFNYVTTDAAVGGSWFATLNSGTVGQSAVAGYEGLPLLTTAASSTAITMIGSQTFVASPATRLAVMIGRVYLPDENVNSFNFYFGFGNKQAAPQTTAFTDGAWIELVTGTSLQFNGKLRTNTGTAQTVTLTNYLVTSGKAQSFEFGVVLLCGAAASGGNTLFFMRDASASSPINSGLWTMFQPTLTNLGQNPQTAARLLRPHQSFVSTNGAAVAASCETPEYAIQRLLTY